MTEHAAPIHASAPAGPVDLARLEALAETATDHIWSVPKGGLTSEYVAALANAAPSLLAAARAVERVRGLADVVARLQPADPDTHDRDVSWLALLEALEPDDE